jgi:hypothetical protein
VDFSHVFNLDRWRRRFKSEDAVVGDAVGSGRAPDATVDDVGVPGQAVGFDGRPVRSDPGNGQGSGDPGGPGWAGWGA